MKLLHLYIIKFDEIYKVDDLTEQYWIFIKILINVTTYVILNYPVMAILFRNITLTCLNQYFVSSTILSILQAKILTLLESYIRITIQL